MLCGISKEKLRLLAVVTLAVAPMMMSIASMNNKILINGLPKTEGVSRMKLYRLSAYLAEPPSQTISFKIK